MALISAEDLQRIEAAVKDVERWTAGEIVVVVATRSATWSGARTVFALVVASLGCIVASRVVGVHVGWMALAAPALFVVAWLVAGLGPVARALAGSAALDDAVLRAAKVAFLDHGVHETKMRAGVLVYLSLFEHRVQVLGDAAVHKLVGDVTWAAYAKRIGIAMSARNVDDLIAVVRDVGAILSRSFPRSAHDDNELTDAARVAHG